MAMLDYGAIVLKNGKLVNDDLFTPMIDAVGWEDTDNDCYNHYGYSYTLGKNYVEKIPIELKDKYFTYIGDSECTIGFYKEQLVLVYKFNDGTFFYDKEYFNCTSYTWSKWVKYAGMNMIVVTQRNGYLVCRWKYKGDKYKVYFGYGVDVDCYKKWRIVNYYRSPGFTLRQAIRWFRDKWFEWKYRN